jgi:hypothetical protein
METVNLIFNAENVRMLVILAFGFCGYMLIKSQMKDMNYKIDRVESSLLKAMDEKIDAKLNAFHAQLKANDFAHLNNTIEALTFTLEKNGFLKREDKEYIDGRLDK